VATNDKITAIANLGTTTLLLLHKHLSVYTPCGAWRINVC
jgi:hypothetical protein